MKHKKYVILGTAAICAGLLAGCQSKVMENREYIPAEGETGATVETAQFDPLTPAPRQGGQQGQLQQQPAQQRQQQVQQEFAPMETLHSEPIISPVRGKSGSSAAATTASSVYVVKSGDYPEKIARKHGISTAALMQANNLTEQSAKKLQVGQKLNIPGRSGNAVATRRGNSSATGGAATSSAKLNTDGTYTVQAGDMIATIAKKLQVKQKDLMDANNLDFEKAKRLQVGQKLNVPGKSAATRTTTPTRQTQTSQQEKPVVQQPVNTNEEDLTGVLEKTQVTETPVIENTTTPGEDIVSGELITEILDADTTLDALAAKHKTTAAKIRELNPGMVPEDGKLTRGMILLVQPNAK